MTVLPPQASLSHLALGLSVGTSALIAALLLAVSGVMISKYGEDSLPSTKSRWPSFISRAYGENHVRGHFYTRLRIYQPVRERTICSDLLFFNNNKNEIFFGGEKFMCLFLVFF